jgi:hypothetical protein
MGEFISFVSAKFRSEFFKQSCRQPLYLRQMIEEREARVAIGLPLIVPPQQMRAEHEAWVAIGVPLIEPLLQSKPRPCEKHFTRVITRLN